MWYLSHQRSSGLVFRAKSWALWFLCCSHSWLTLASGEHLKSSGYFIVLTSYLEILSLPECSGAISLFPLFLGQCVCVCVCLWCPVRCLLLNLEQRVLRISPSQIASSVLCFPHGYYACRICAFFLIIWIVVSGDSLRLCAVSPVKGRLEFSVHRFKLLFSPARASHHVWQPNFLSLSVPRLLFCNDIHLMLPLFRGSSHGMPQAFSIALFRGSSHPSSLCAS